MATSDKHSNRKRACDTREGSAFSNEISFGDDKYRNVQAWEAVHLRYGPGGGFSVASLSVTMVFSNEGWLNAMLWCPSEDNSYTLDPNGDTFNMAVDAHVMDVGVTQEPKKKKGRSERSVSWTLAVEHFDL